MRKWLKKALANTKKLDAFSRYVLARAHMDGYSLIRFGTKQDDDQEMLATYLACSSKGTSCTERVSKKCKCEFELRISCNVMGEITYKKNNLKHNHKPYLVTRNDDGIFELEIQQRFLLEEEEEEMAKGVITRGLDRDWARKFLCEEVVKRYKKLFEAHKDEKAVETLLEVQIIVFIMCFLVHSECFCMYYVLLKCTFAFPIWSHSSIVVSTRNI
jgi:hypothetical protein